MPTKIEKDIVTGRDTTGHEWDGLKELNTPLPKWWVYVLYATIVWAAVWFVLYPSVPGITGYFPGVLGYSQRTAVMDDVRAVAAQRAVTMDRIKALSFADIRKDPQLMAAAGTAGRIAFANNCQPCHGAGGGGQTGYPALAAGAWIWGGSLNEIYQTITYGIRSGDDKAREGQMPRFGVDGILKPAEIQQVADYVMTLYGERSRARTCRQARSCSPTTAPCVTARQGRGIARRARRGWPRTFTSTAATGPPSWHRSPRRGWG